MPKEIKFENEFILHMLTQKHLKELFDLECVASEIQLNGLRLDNLAFNMKTSSFVIIEYKNQFSRSVLKQAQEYYDLIRKNREHFKDRLGKEIDVDFDNAGIMIIGPKFSRNQIEKAESHVELWKVSLFDDGKVTYENLKTNEIRELKVNPDDLRITEDMLLKDKPEEMIDLYNNFKKRISNEFSDVEIRYLVDQFSLRANGSLLCLVVFLKSSFNIYIYADNLKNADKAIDISTKSTGGNAKYKLNYNSDDDFDYFLDLFKQTYNQKSGKNE